MSAVRYIDLSAPWQPEDRIELRDRRAALIVADVMCTEASAADLQQMLCVELAPDPRVSLESSLVLEFRECVWVLPETTPGRDELIFEAWAPLLQNSDRLFALRITRMPLAWRRRRFFLPPVVPRLGCFPKRTLPAWPGKHPIALSDIPRSIGCAQAIELAKAFALQKGWAWVEPARASQLGATRDAPRRWEVYSHASGGLGAMARVEIDLRTGAVCGHGHLPR